MGLAVTIRPFDGSDADYEAAAAVWNAIHPDIAGSGAEMRSRDGRTDPEKYYLCRWMAKDTTTGDIVGGALLRHMTWSFDPHRFVFFVAVIPDRQRQGIGRALYQTVSDTLHELGAGEAWTTTRETLADTLGFLARRGFEEKERLWESRLNVPAFDAAPFAPLLGRIADDGITIVTLAEVQQRDPKWLHIIYDLDATLSADAPSPRPFTHPSIEDYTLHHVNASCLLPDGYFLAMDGERYVGVSFVERRDRWPDRLAHGFTGVRRKYRGRGIATTLKVKTIEYARQHGYTEIVTENSTLNAPMLAVNEKLGFVRQPAWVELLKKLER